MPTLSGTVKNASGSFVQRVVRAYNRDTGAPVGYAVSDATTGAYSITTSSSAEHFVLMHDMSAIGDQYLSNVVLAMHMDDTGLTDLKGHTATLNGNVTRSATQSKFGGYSAYFDGAGDWISFPDSTDFTIGTADFTVEFWMKSAGNGAYDQICGQRGSAGNADSPFGITRNNLANTLIFNYGNGTTTFQYGATSTTAVFDNVWHHVACVRSGTRSMIFIDGVLDAEVALPSNYSVYDGASTFSIGRHGEYNGQYYAGYIDDFRFTKGVARYTATFTPPAAAFPDVLFSGGTENALIFDRVTPV